MRNNFGVRCERGCDGAREKGLHGDSQRRKLQSFSRAVAHHDGSALSVATLGGNLKNEMGQDKK